MAQYLLVFTCLLYNFIGFAQNDSYATITNIPYYSATAFTTDTYIRERCVLDLYYPKNTKNFGTIIWFHGGGLSEGEKEIPEALKNKGYAVVGVNYRLSPNVSATKSIDDAAAAIAWVFNTIKRYGGSEKLIFLTGHSAGGYLAMMAGLDPSRLSTYNIDANKVAGILPLSGQCITHYEIRKERNIPNYTAVIDTYAPLTYVRADAPPLTLITGDRELELLGRYEENAYMARMMKVSGHTKTKLYELQGFGHAMTEPAFPLLIKEISHITKTITL